MRRNSLKHGFQWGALAAVSLTLISCGSGNGPTSSEDTTVEVQSIENYELVWSDEFSEGTSPSVENWNIETGYGVDGSGWGNNEWQLYTDSPDNVRVEDGNLVISARCDSGVCGVRDGSITSARLTTKDKVEVKFGKIQARIKMPPGKGMWPAFWMLGSNFPETAWPGVGEIDIVEMHQFYSDAFTTHFTVHWSGPLYEADERPVCSSPANDTDTSSQHCKSEFLKLDEPLSDDYHVYEVDWNEDRIIGKIDGIPYFTKTIDPDDMELNPNGSPIPSYMDEFLNSYFMILNIAVGGTLGGPPAADLDWSEQNMLVDWVRVYQKPVPASLEVIPESGEGIGIENVINSAVFGGDNVTTDLNSTAVTPLVGNTVMEVNYTSAGTFFSGSAFVLNHADISPYGTLVFSVNTTQFPDFNSLLVELVDSRNTGGALGKVSVPLSDYTPVVSGDWLTYEIPLSDFVGVDLQNVTMFGFWNPQDSSSQLAAGTLYFDDIRFEATECTTAGEVTLNAEEYAESASSATVTVSDACAASSLVVVTVENGTDSIGVGIDLDAAGNGSATVNFGATSDADTRIQVSEGDVLSVSYTDNNGDARGDAASIIAAASIPSELAVYSETNSSASLTYVQIIDAGVDFGGNSTPVDEMSTAVTPYEGSTVLEATFNDDGRGYGGFIFNFGGAVVPPNPTTGQDVSAYESLQFAINTTAMASFADLVVQLEDGTNNPNVFLSNYTPSTSGDWAVYEIPLSDFTDLNTSNLTLLGFWNASSAVGSVAITSGTLYFDDILFVREPAPSEPAGDALAFYSDTRTDAVLSYAGIINSADFSGNNTEVDLTNTEVDALEGSNVLKATFNNSGATYGGFLFNFDGADISANESLKFAIDTSAMSGFADLVVQLEDGSATPSVFLSSYTPTTSGNWSLYEIPLSDFTGVDLTAVTLLGFWNASSTEGSVTLTYGDLYFDDMYFFAPEVTVEPAGDALAFYSDNRTDAVLSYSAIINSADFSGNNTVVDQTNSEVTPLEGSNVLKASFNDSGATYGGFLFNFGGADISGYESLKFAIDTSAMTGYADLVVQLEDGSVSPNVFLSNYTPTTSGSWSLYEIPLSDFSGVDLSAVTLLGFWNASSTAGSVTLEFGDLYFDDMYFFAPAGSATLEAGIYSESKTDTVLTYTSIINAADFGGNSTVVELDNTDVTALDGSGVLKAAFNNSGSTYGGFIFDFGGTDVSAYETINFAIDTSAMAGFADLVIQPEDGTSPPPTVFLSNYTPTVSGNWEIYAIPLSDFSGLDTTNLTLLGFWNASSTAGSVTLTYGTLYFDDIYLSNP